MHNSFTDVARKETVMKIRLTSIYVDDQNRLLGAGRLTDPGSTRCRALRECAGARRAPSAVGAHHRAGGQRRRLARISCSAARTRADREGIARDALPAAARVTCLGQAQTYQETQGNVALFFGLALLIVYLVLAAQFESFIHPVVIMVTVPLAFTGGLLALLLTARP